MSEEPKLRVPIIPEMKILDRVTGRKPIPRDDTKVTGDHSEYDRAWFGAHPGEDEYIREFVPGEVQSKGAATNPSWVSLRHVRRGSTSR
jgi:hypothetical protein